MKKKVAFLALAALLVLTQFMVGCSKDDTEGTLVVDLVGFGSSGGGTALTLRVFDISNSDYPLLQESLYGSGYSTKLNAGNYLVTVYYNNLHATQSCQIRVGKDTHLMFARDKMEP